MEPAPTPPTKAKKNYIRSEKIGSGGVEEGESLPAQTNNPNSTAGKYGMALNPPKIRLGVHMMGRLLERPRGVIFMGGTFDGFSLENFDPPNCPKMPSKIPIFKKFDTWRQIKRVKIC